MSNSNAAPAKEQDLNELLQIRRDKLTQMQQAGQNPFELTKFPVDSHAEEIKEKFARLQPEEESGEVVCVAGRMMS